VQIIELHKKPCNDFQVVGRLAQVLRRADVQVVHSHNWGTLVETSLARRWAGVPVHVHTEHGQGLHENLAGLRQWLRRRARRWAFERMNQLLSCADSVRPLIEQQCGFARERMRFLPNGVDPPAPATPAAAGRLRESFGIAKDAIVVGSVGRLVPVKDFTLAVHAIAELSHSGVDAHLVLVGDGPEEAGLLQTARDCRVSGRVHLAGRHPDVSPWLRMFDLYLNCSRSEAMSLGILEAMAAARPMVVVDVGDNRLLVGGDRPCGLVVAERSANAIAAAIRRLAGDQRLCAQFAAHAGARFERDYSCVRMVERHERLYEELLAAKSICGRKVKESAPATAREAACSR
jgi:glycosyltransferase involved in cell wall biosynthesis